MKQNQEKHLLRVTNIHEMCQIISSLKYYFHLHNHAQLYTQSSLNAGHIILTQTCLLRQPFVIYSILFDVTIMIIIGNCLYVYVYVCVCVCWCMCVCVCVCRCVYVYVSVCVGLLYCTIMVTQHLYYTVQCCIANQDIKIQSASLK